MECPVYDDTPEKTVKPLTKVVLQGLCDTNNNCKGQGVERPVYDDTPGRAVETINIRGPARPVPYQL